MDTDRRFRNSEAGLEPEKKGLTRGRPEAAPASARARERRSVPVWRGVRAAVDWVLPPRCCLCSSMIAAEDGVCSACFPTLQFLTEPLCDCCGRPLSGAALSQDVTAVVAGENAASTALPPRCGACLSAPPPYDWMRASFAYNASSRALVLALK